MSDAENARLHGVAIKTIRRWRREYQRRGRPRGQAHLSARCPRCADGVLDEPAYAELFGWYLGDGHISRGRRGVYNLHIYNDVTYVTVNAHIQELMRSVKPQCRPHTRHGPRMRHHHRQLETLALPFPQLGPGRKHERELGMQEWQWAIVSTHPEDFLRGLFHSDGCRSNNYSTRSWPGRTLRCYYTRWHFTNHSAEIRQWCGDALDLVDVAWRQSSWKTLSVARRDDVARLDELIGLKS